MIETLERLIYTLNGVEVKGRDNIDKLLGCIMTLESLIEELKERENAE